MTVERHVSFCIRSLSVDLDLQPGVTRTHGSRYDRAIDSLWNPTP